MRSVNKSEANIFTAVEKSNIRYWLIVLLLLAAFATATLLLYISAVESLKASGSQFLRSTSVLVASLSGLVLIFCLYMFQRQTDLAHLRGRLLTERVKAETLKAQLDELSSLFEVGTAINMRLKLDGIIRIVVRRLPSCFAADRTSLMMIDPTSGLLECKAAWGFGSDRAQAYRSEIGEGIAGWVASNGRPLLLHGREIGRFAQYAKRETEIASAMCVPIKLKNVTIGVLNVTRIRSSERFKRQHLRLLMRFARNIAGAIRKAHLYEEVGAEKTQLEDSNKELLSLNQMKEVFLATLCHELRTPLTCIVSFAEILDERGPELAETDKQKFVSIVHEQAEKLLDLTEQIMDLSRLHKGTLEMDFKETDLNEVVQSAYVTLAQPAAAKSVTIETKLDGGLRPINADPTKLRQIVLNLAGNAIKYTEAGGRVVLATRSCGARVELSVTDTGIGLSSADISHIFELFSQVSQPGQARPKGLGLGLYLVKKFVELHNGEVSVESEKGTGATFRVCLPAEPRQPTAVQEELATASNKS